jgi:hypothetical protein
MRVACGDKWRRELVVRGLPFGPVYDLRAGALALTDAVLKTAVAAELLNAAVVAVGAGGRVRCR